MVDNAVMVRRHFSILVAAWSFWGVPVLCVAGVLEHPCAPNDNHCQESDAPDCSHEGPDCPHDGGCGHGSDCESDPCSTIVLGRERPSDDTPSVSFEAIATVQWTQDSLQPLRSTRTPVNAATGYVQLPTHASDTPLLV